MTFVAERVRPGPGTAASTLHWAAAVLRRVRGVVRALGHRRHAAVLLSLDDRMLRDIGITRFDVTASLSAPLLSDPTLGLASLRAERQAAHRAQARERLRARPWEL